MRRRQQVLDVLKSVVEISGRLLYFYLFIYFKESLKIHLLPPNDEPL